MRMRIDVFLAALVALAATAGLVASCAHPSSVAAPPPLEPSPPRGPTQSNVLRSDYVGSAPCTPCHTKEAEAWTRSPMHHMTRLPAAPDVHTSFDGRAMHFKRDTVTLESHGAGRFVRITRAGVPDQIYRVTRVIGGRTREDFAGVRVASTGDGDVNPNAPGADADEMVLPVSQLLFSPSSTGVGTPGALRYKGYSVLVHERSVARPGPGWSQTCLFCHNTVPLFSTSFAALRGRTKSGYQGEAVDQLLPSDRRWTWRITDTAAFAQAASDEIAHLGGPRPDANETSEALLGKATAVTREHFGADDLVELGIGCESCHGGARAHLNDPATTPSFTPYAPFLGLEAPVQNTKTATTAGADARAQSINRVCARCHQVLFSGYPWTWEGGHRQSNDRGGSPINSGEGRDFLLGGCASALACTACHDPHDARDRRAKDDALATPAGNAVCTRCHGELAKDDALRAHAHHDPHGAGGACVACHMPRKNMGLDLRLTRYHRIGSPTDPARVLLDRPLECALCHADKSTIALVTTMETWWKKAYSRDLLARLYGDLDAKNLSATLTHGKAHERAVAVATLGALGDKEMAPAIARELVNEYPLVRGFAARALAGALKRDCKIEVETEGVEQIEAEARACFAAVGLSPPVFPPPSETSHGGSGNGATGGDGEVPED